MDIAGNLAEIKRSLPGNVTVVAVSKTKSSASIMEAYEAGQRIFGENKVQELAWKREELPKDIEWHMIGHLQTNKVKYIISFVNLIHSVDRLKLLQEIDKRAGQHNRVVDCLLQLHIAEEEGKFGFSEEELNELLEKDLLKTLKNVRIVGLMGMATYTRQETQLKKEFAKLNAYFQQLKKSYFHKNDSFTILSMGMSGDYALAVEEGSNMVRVGSAIFGTRN